jgi:single-strand DNA-binding protein
MANLNKVFLIGNLTRDPELRYTPQGTAVVNLRLATNRRFKDKAGQQKEEVCFVTAVVWDKQAEACNQYLRKGSQICVEGRLQSRSFEDNSGQKRHVLEVRAERIQFLGAPPSRAAAGTEETKETPAPVEEETNSAQDWLDEGKDTSNEN